MHPLGLRKRLERRLDLAKATLRFRVVFTVVIVALAEISIGIYCSVAGSSRGLMLGPVILSALVVFLLLRPSAQARSDLMTFDRDQEKIRNYNDGVRARHHRERSQELAVAQPRLDQSPEWRPAEVPDQVKRLDIFGGTLTGWAGLLTVFGSSVLGQPYPVTVLDLSREEVSRDFARVARRTGRLARDWKLTADLRRMDLLAGMPTGQIVDVLVESIHHDGADRNARAVDHRILSAVCEALDGRVTIGRVVAGVHAVMRFADSSGLLTPAERDHIAVELFTDAYRKSIELNLIRIESHLSPLRSLGADDDGADANAGRAALSCLTAEPGIRGVGGELLQDLLVQWLINRVTGAAMPPGSSVIIAAADELSGVHLQRLSDACERRGVQLVNLYRRLRRDGLEAIGTGDVAFMRLGNFKDASAAADFAGRQHTFKISNLTRTLGRGESRSVAEQRVPTWFQTFVHAMATNWSQARSEQRVYEYAVEPTVLQGLPDYALLQVTHGPGGDVRVRAIECNPGIVLLPGFTGGMPATPPTVSRRPEAPSMSAEPTAGRDPVLSDLLGEPREEPPERDGRGDAAESPEG